MDEVFRSVNAQIAEVAKALDAFCLAIPPMFRFCANKTRTQKKTFLCVMFGRKKDRGRVKDKYAKFLESAKARL